MSNAKMKAKFRASKRWREFRKYCDSFYRGQDFITGHKLLKGHNLHHMDLNPEHYTDTDNVRNFLPLNKTTHDTLHWLFRYYAKDPDILVRLKEVLDEMILINEKGEEDDSE